MAIMIPRTFKGAQDLGMPMHTWPKHPRRHLPNPTVCIFHKHLRRNRQHLVFAWTTCPFFAPITSKGMHRPRSDHRVLVVQILYEFGQCGWIHVMV